MRVSNYYSLRQRIAYAFRRINLSILLPFKQWTNKKMHHLFFLYEAFHIETISNLNHFWNANSLFLSLFLFRFNETIWNLCLHSPNCMYAFLSPYLHINECIIFIVNITTYSMWTIFSFRLCLRLSTRFVSFIKCMRKKKNWIQWTMMRLRTLVVIWKDLTDFEPQFFCVCPDWNG